MSLGIAGASSTIAKEFGKLLPPDERVQSRRIQTLDLTQHRYLICTGFLAGKALRDISFEDAQLTWELNFRRIAEFCDRLFDANPRARVCVIGSESGVTGSYDMAYAGAKAALHLYVETKRLYADEQMIVALAPHIILDSAMTERRSDIDDLKFRGVANRLGRWLTATEVAAEAHHLLYAASPALSGQVIRMRAE